jgi:hypothetical protein
MISRIPPKGWHEHPRLFSFARRTCRLWNGESLLLSSTRSQAQLRTQDTSVDSPNELRDAMPQHAILDMKLKGSGSDLDGLGDVVVSLFVAASNAMELSLDGWGRREASS